MFQRILFSFFLVIFSFVGWSQDHITWEFSYNSSAQQIELKAKLDEGWHLYSQHIMENAGPVATAIKFDKNKALKLIGNVQEPISIEEYDMNFESMVNYFKNEVVFSQKIKVKKDTTIKGSVTSMICNDVMCLPPEEQKFEIKITKK